MYYPSHRVLMRQEVTHKPLNWGAAAKPFLCLSHEKFRVYPLLPLLSGGLLV